MDYCGHCRNFQRDVMDTLEWDEGKVQIGKIRCGEFRSTCLHRFGVQHIPQLYLIDNNTLYDFPFQNLNKENVLEALTISLDPSKGRPVPPAESLLTTVTRDSWEIAEKIHFKLENYVKNKFDGAYEWNNIRYTLGLLSAAFLLGFLLIYLILRSLCRCCCGRKNNVGVAHVDSSEKKEQ
jgi:hypothetical protein